MISYKNEDSVKSLANNLNEENGNPTVSTPKMDEDAFIRLKQLEQMVNGGNRTANSQD